MAQSTLFDRVVGSPQLAEAERYLVIGFRRDNQGFVARGASGIAVQGNDEILMLGDMLGEMLRAQMGHVAGEDVLVSLMYAAAKALHGEGLPSVS